MGKVIRTDKDGVQKIRANEIVPGDIVEVSGQSRLFVAHPTPAVVVPAKTGWPDEFSKKI
jgi:hypothetical protein